MVGRDVQQDGNVGTEVVHVVELERAQLNDVVLVGLLSHLEGQRVADVASQPGIVACSLEDVIDETGGRRLAVGTGNTDHLGVGIAACKLYLADDADATFLGFDHHRCRVGDTRALDDFVSIKNTSLRMLPFLPRYLVVVEQFLIFVGNLRHVRNKHIEPFFLCQYSCTGTAFTCS